MNNFFMFSSMLDLFEDDRERPYLMGMEKNVVNYNVFEIYGMQWNYLKVYYWMDGYGGREWSLTEFRDQTFYIFLVMLKNFASFVDPRWKIYVNFTKIN